MRTEGIYQFADHTFSVKTLYDFTHKESINYAVSADSEADAIIQTTEADIAREDSNMEELLNFSPDSAYLEFLAVQRKVTEALLSRDTILFHASALAVDGQGYLFTALSGTGKSTHASLWRKQFGDRVTMINDDKPFIRIGDAEARVYGSPWNGKHNLSTNTSVPIKAIVILTRDTTNHIERITADEAFPILYQQTQRFPGMERQLKVLDLLKALTERVALYRLGCNMDPEAAIVSYEGMNHD